MNKPRDGEPGGAAPAESQSTFLRRWSERKRGVANGVDRDPVGVPDTSPRVEGPGVEESSSEPVLTDADLPPVDALDEASEYSGFLSPGVSEELRRLALRKLFHLPSFNIRDGLDDYDEDFTRFAALGDVMTQDLRHRIETAARRRGESDATPPETGEAVAGEPVPEASAADGEESAIPAPARAQAPDEADSGSVGKPGQESGERG